MDVDAMTVEERNDLMKRGACFFCKQPGHLSKECPKKKKNYPNYPNKKPDMTPKELKAHIHALNTEERKEFTREMMNNDNDKGSDNEDF